MESKVCPLVGLSHYLNSLVGLSVDKDTNTHIYVGEIQPACSKRKTFEGENLREFCVFAKVFSMKFGAYGILLHSKSKQYVKVFFAKIIFFTNSRKFSPSKVFHYMLP